MKVHIGDFTKLAKLVKKDERYEVYDLKLENLVTSMTILHSDRSTTGHSHENAEEVYLFLQGKGEIQLDDSREKVEKEDLILIPKGVFHRVFNEGNEDLVFISIFEKYTGRGK